MSDWFSIKFNNKFVFPDPEPLIINIQYGWCRIYSQFLLFGFIFINIVIKVDHFLYVVSI